MDAEGANKSNDNGANGSRDIAGVTEGIRHGQNTSSQRTLQQMKQSLRVPER